jgi:hypothetical protein
VDEVKLFVAAGVLMATGMPARMKTVTRRSDPKNTLTHLHKDRAFVFRVSLFMRGSSEVIAIALLRGVQGMPCTTMPPAHEPQCDISSQLKATLSRQAVVSSLLTVGHGHLTEVGTT